MTYAILILTTVVLALFSYWMNRKSEFGKTERILRGLALGVNANIAACLVLIFGFRKYVFRWALPLKGQLALLAGGLMIGLCLWLLLKVLGRLFVRQSQTVLPIWRSLGWSVLGGGLLGLAGAAFFISRWFHDYFGTLSADQFLFLLTDGQGDATADVNAQIFNFMVLPVIAMIVVGIQLGLIRRPYRLRPAIQKDALEAVTPSKGKTSRVVALAAGVVLVAYTIFYAFQQ